MVNFLMQLHPEEGIGVYFPISPPDIPISGPWFSLNNPTQFLCNFLNDGILSIRDIDDNFFGFRFVT